jgi:tetratricopeptide (TPR) repeat protein
MSHAGKSRGWPILIVAAALLFFRSVHAADLVSANQLFRKGDYAECVEATAKGIEENPFTDQFPILKLRAEMQLGRYADALVTLDAALQKFPTSVQLRWLGRDVCRFNGMLARATELDKEMATLVAQTAWRYSDPANQVVLGRWMLTQAVDPKKVLTGTLNEAKRRSPGLVDVHLAIGDLALEKHDYLMAGDAFQQAVKIDEASAEAWLGVAKSFAPSDDEKATSALAKAMELNPHLIDAQLFAVDNLVDQEKYDEAEKLIAEIAAINSEHPVALAYRAVIAHLRNQPDKETQWRSQALRHWPTNPAVDHVIGKKLSQKYRFAEGEKYQRKALEFDPKYLPAKSQLAQDLLRLGREEEGLKVAEEVYNADGYNIFAHNLVTLQENLVKFRTLEADGLIVRMDAREAEIYGGRVLALLQQCKIELCAKYEVTLPQPVIVEIFPRHQDFAIRTFGLPGGRGFLGVCFGTVVTAPSPASQGTTPSCWEATLWHEFCHVVTLNKTNNKMPRWLSEGISVYEERQKNTAWGQSMNIRNREMTLGDDLTPISKLSSAFLNPKTPEHLQFAYFESSLVVEFLIEKYGLDTLKRVLVDLGVGMPINESLARYAGSSATLDEEFAKYAREKANALAPEADFSSPELPRRASTELLEGYLKDHPNNYATLSRLAQQFIAEKKWDKAKETIAKMRALYPRDATASGGNFLLAVVHRELKENQPEREVLNLLADSSSDSVAIFDRLTEVAANAEEWELVREMARRWLAGNPLTPEPHRRAAAAAEKLGDYPLAAESYRALLQMDPFDAAEAHYQLASALHRQGKAAEAKREVLLALEETPRYAIAQKLLLQIVDAAPPSPAQSPETELPKNSSPEPQVEPAPKTESLSP